MKIKYDTELNMLIEHINTYDTTNNTYMIERVHNACDHGFSDEDNISVDYVSFLIEFGTTLSKHNIDTIWIVSADGGEWFIFARPYKEIYHYLSNLVYIHEEPPWKKYENKA